MSDAEVCEMPECASTEELRQCLDPDENSILACAGCRADWPRQLRVAGGVDG